MSNKVKFFHSNMTGAPVITGAWGDMVAMLDACLVNGFNLKTVQTLTQSDGVATLSFPSAHGFTPDQVVLIEGAEQAGYNGEFTVLAVTTNSFSIAVALDTPNVASGTITVKAAPLDFEITHSAARKRVYRSKNILSHRRYLRIDDTLPNGYDTNWAKFARVTVAESMLDIDTPAGARMPYDPANPTKNEVPSGTGSSGVYGWYKWYYARYNREMDNPGTISKGFWLLVGDDMGFYFIQQVDFSYGARHLYGFTDFPSVKPGDLYNTLLLFNDWYATAGNYFNYHASGSRPLTGDGSGKSILKSYSSVGNQVPAYFHTLLPNNGQAWFGNSGMPYPNNPDYGIYVTPMTVWEAGSNLRGSLPGAYFAHQGKNFPDLQILDNLTGFAGRKMIGARLSSDINPLGESFMTFDLGNWR